MTSEASSSQARVTTDVVAISDGTREKIAQLR